MEFVIRVNGLELSDDQRIHIDRRVRFAVSRFTDCLDRVDVLVADENGPRGGVDARCRIRAKLAKRGMVYAEDRASAVEHAVNLAAGRLGRSLSREIDRRKSR